MSETTDKSATESKPQAIEDLLARDNQARLEGLRGKVMGQFLRLTMQNQSLPVFVRASALHAYHDRFNENVNGKPKLSEFCGCWITGQAFGFSVNERAEDIATLLRLTEGEYSNSDLRDVLQSFFIAAGLPAAESQALLTPGNQSALALKCAEIVERLSVGSLPSEAQVELRAEITLLIRALGITREPTHQLRDLAEAVRAARQVLRKKAVPRLMEAESYLAIWTASEALYLALGGESTDTFHDDPSGLLVRCIEEATARLTSAKEESAARDASTIRLGDEIRRLEKDLATQTEKFLQTESRLREVMAAAGELCRAHGIDDHEFDQEAFLGVDYYGATVRLLKRCAEEVAQFKSEAAQLREKHEASVTARMLVEQSGADAYQHQQAQITALKAQVAQQLGQMADDRGELLKKSEELATLRQRLSVYEPGELRQQIIVLCADLRKARREISELSALRDQWLQRAQALEAKVAEMQEATAKGEATP